MSRGTHDARTGRAASSDSAGGGRSEGPSIAQRIRRALLWTTSTPRYIRARIKSVPPTTDDSRRPGQRGLPCTTLRTPVDAAATMEREDGPTYTSWRLYVEDGWVDGRCMYEECGADARCVATRATVSECSVHDLVNAKMMVGCVFYDKHMRAWSWSDPETTCIYRWTGSVTYNGPYTSNGLTLPRGTCTIEIEGVSAAEVIQMCANQRLGLGQLTDAERDRKLADEWSVTAAPLQVQTLGGDVYPLHGWALRVDLLGLLDELHPNALLDFVNPADSAQPSDRDDHDGSSAAHSSCMPFFHKPQRVRASVGRPSPPGKEEQSYAGVVLLARASDEASRRVVPGVGVAGENWNTMDPETRAGILDGRIGATEPIVLLRMTPDPAAPTPSTEALVAASSTRSARSAEINWGNTEVAAPVSGDTPVAIKVPSGDDSEA